MTKNEQSFLGLNKETDDIMDIEYYKFVEGLMKPEDDLNNEICIYQEAMMDKVIKLSSFATTYYDNILGYIIEPYKNIIGRAKCLSLKHMATGFIGECGELLDTVKRITIYRKTFFDIHKDGHTFYENLIEEFGDFYFYIIGVDTILNKIIQIKGFERNELDDINSMFLEKDILLGALEEFINSINECIVIYCTSKNIKIPETITLKLIKEKNKEKLQKRYKQKYSDQQANERADKQ